MATTTMLVRHVLGECNTTPLKTHACLKTFLGVSHINVSSLGEKPFETIEDLVQDGLITLYMEANNVEDYLQSARETRSIHRPSDAGHLGTIPEGHHSPSDEAVYSGESSEGITPPHTPAKTSCLPRSAKPIYQPCTIQQKRDSIHHSESGASRARLSRIYEEIEDDGRVAPVMNGFIKDDGRVAPVMNGFIKDDGRVAPVMNGFIKTSHDTKAAVSQPPHHYPIYQAFGIVTQPTKAVLQGLACMGTRLGRVVIIYILFLQLYSQYCVA